MVKDGIIVSDTLHVYVICCLRDYDVRMLHKVDLYALTWAYLDIVCPRSIKEITIDDLIILVNEYSTLT